MSAERVEYHQGAIADVKSAVAWYQKRSPKAALDFIEEMHRAAETSVKLRNVGRQERTTPDDSCFGDSRLPSFIPNKNP
jgi:plasmid stabilization system protein ParE